MNRRIVLSDKEIVSGDFFRGLADLNFEKKDDLWVPPQDVATGQIVAASSVRDFRSGYLPRGTSEEGDLVAQVQICSSDGRRLLVIGAPITHNISWVAHPNEPVLMSNGRRLTAFHFAPIIS